MKSWRQAHRWVAGARRGVSCWRFAADGIVLYCQTLLSVVTLRCVTEQHACGSAGGQGQRRKGGRGGGHLAVCLSGGAHTQGQGVHIPTRVLPPPQPPSQVDRTALHAHMDLLLLLCVAGLLQACPIAHQVELAFKALLTPTSSTTREQRQILRFCRAWGAPRRGKPQLGLKRAQHAHLLR